MKYNITFSYGANIHLGTCVVTAQDDTSMTNYYNSTESGYTDFTTLDLNVGEKLYVTYDKRNIFFARISAIAANSITLSSNPGQVIHNRVLTKGHISPYVRRTPYLYSYPCSNYCGASLSKKGENFSVYTESNPIYSDATHTETNSVISLYFLKGNNVEEIKVEVKVGSESSAIRDFQKILRLEKDVNFMSEIKKINKDVIGINSITASNKSKLY
tara:strand:- start:953 stop:1597 length:645 start_codon:yes stop_codon:yes gene_type:complete